MAVMTNEQALAFIADTPRTAKLATVKQDGSPHVVPVWVAVDGEQIVFNTGVDTAKGKAMRRDPRVSLCVDDDTPPFSFVTISGTVELITDLDEVLKWATVIGGRYMGADRAEEFGRRNAVEGEYLVRVTPTRIIGELAVSD
jgi:PPOX class probable F420-dependent enzyme